MSHKKYEVTCDETTVCRTHDLREALDELEILRNQGHFDAEIAAYWCGCARSSVSIEDLGETRIVAPHDLKEARQFDLYVCDFVRTESEFCEVRRTRRQENPSGLELRHLRDNRTIRERRRRLSGQVKNIMRDGKPGPDWDGRKI